MFFPVTQVNDLVTRTTKAKLIEIVGQGQLNNFLQFFVEAYLNQRLRKVQPSIRHTNSAQLNSIQLVGIGDLRICSDIKRKTDH